MLTTAHDPAGRLAGRIRARAVDADASGRRRRGAGAPQQVRQRALERGLVGREVPRTSTATRSSPRTPRPATSPLRDLLEADRPVSLYLTMPPSDIIRTRPLLRLLLNQIGRRLTETHGLQAACRRPSPPRLLLMLDEFPALGRLDFLQTALAYLPGYGITRVSDRPGPRPARPDLRPRRVDRLELPRPGGLRGQQGRDGQG